MADDLELLGLELAREIRMCQEELLKKRELVTELSKNQTANLAEIEDLTEKLKRCSGEIQEVKAQLQVRSEATHRLEQENASLRDSVARLHVQVESNSVERERLMQRWQLAEVERVNWKTKCENLQEVASESAAFKEQCILLQNQLRSAVSKIVAQQEIVQKEFLKAERSAQDSVAFAKTVSSHCKLQETDAKNLLNTVQEAENKLLHTSGVIADLRRQRDQLVSASKLDHQEDKSSSYLVEWQRYQQDMKKRVEGFMGENQRLLEELNLVREQVDSAVCQKCSGAIVTAAHEEILPAAFTPARLHLARRDPAANSEAMSGTLATALCLVTYLCALHDPVAGNVPKDVRHRHKTLVDLMKRTQLIRVPGPDLDADKDDVLGKRQEFLFDDYGHMRFGKREESDDYGHLRFGRAGD